MEFENNFASPPKINSPFPFWFLNDDLNEENITWALKEFKDKHIYSVVLHPRTGLEVEYLSDIFWEKMEFIIKKCDELDMKVILYDEYNWPSGPMGGKLQRDHPEFKQKFLNFKIIKKGKTVRLSFDGQYLTAFQINPSSGEVNELIQNYDGTEFYWERPEKNWEVIIFYICEVEDKFASTSCAPFTKGERGYLDLLNPKAVEYFIEKTHEEYKKRLSKYFGNTIIAMFTDEPGNYAGLMWTDQLLEKFEAQFSFDLKAKLYQLVYELGVDYLTTRNCYFRLVSELYSMSFFKQIGDWCKQNNIAFTGHLVTEEDLKSFPRVQSSLFLPLREMQIPGIDYLSDKTGYDFESSMFLTSPSFTPKMISSVSHHLGLNRNLCEIFGGCGWKTTLEKLKRLVAWISCCGVNGINHHAAHLSLKGHRKRDWPASHFVQEPWWKYYSTYADFTSRLCYFNSLGTHVANFCVLFPRTALNLNYTLYKKTDIFYQLATTFPKIGEILLRIQCDFDYIFEDMILEGSIKTENGTLTTINEQYNVLIIPPINLIPLKVHMFLLDFYRSGGSIVFLGKIPLHSEDTINDKAISEINKELFGDVLPSNKEFVNQNSKNGTTLFVPLKILKNKKKAEKYFESLFIKYRLKRDIVISKKRREFIYEHRRIEGADFYLVANLSNQEIPQTIKFDSQSPLTVFYPETGKIYHIPDTFLVDGRLKEFPFKPNECLIFLVASKSQIKYPMLAESLQKSKLPPIKLNSHWKIKPLKENLFLLNRWDCKIIERTPKDPEEIEWEKKIWNSLSFRMKFLIRLFQPFIWLFSRGKVKNTTFSASEFLDKYGELLEKIFGIDMYEDFAGFYELLELSRVAAEKAGLKLQEFEPSDVIEIYKSFQLKYLPDSDIKLVYEDYGMPITIELNGMKLTKNDLTQLSEQSFTWDVANREFSVKKLLKLGKNSIKVRLKLPSYPHIMPAVHGIEPIVLKGDFSTHKNSIIPPITINKEQSWVKTGLSNYSGGVIYQNSFNLPQNYLNYNLVLKFGDVRETLELKINGAQVGSRIWAPYEFDITNFVKEGENSIELEIYNTAENFFGNPINSGLLSHVVVNPFIKKITK